MHVTQKSKELRLTYCFAVFIADMEQKVTEKPAPHDKSPKPLTTLPDNIRKRLHTHPYASQDSNPGLLIPQTNV